MVPFILTVYDSGGRVWRVWGGGEMVQAETLKSHRLSSNGITPDPDWMT